MPRVAAAAYAVLVVVFVALGGGDQEPHGAHALKLTVIKYNRHQDRLNPTHAALSLMQRTGSKVARRLNPVKLMTKAKDYLRRRFGRSARVAPVSSWVSIDNGLSDVSRRNLDFVHHFPSDDDARVTETPGNIVDNYSSRLKSGIQTVTETVRTEEKSFARPEDGPHVWEDVKTDADMSSSLALESEIQTETETEEEKLARQRQALWKKKGGPVAGMRVEVRLEPNEEPRTCWLLQLHRSIDEKMWEALCNLTGDTILANEIKFVSEQHMDWFKDPIEYNKLEKGEWVFLKPGAGFATKLLQQDYEVDPLSAVCWILEDPDRTANKLKVICPRAISTDGISRVVIGQNAVTPLGTSWTLGLVQPGIRVKYPAPLALQNARWESGEIQEWSELSCWLLKKVEGYKWEDKLWKAYCELLDASNNILDEKFKKGVFELSEANMKFVHEPFFNIETVENIKTRSWVFLRSSDSNICRVTQRPDYKYLETDSTKVSCPDGKETTADSLKEVILLQPGRL